MPALDDPHFENTVTLICEHNEHGAMGLTINRPLELTHGEVFEQIAAFSEMPPGERNSKKIDEPVLQGGPVSLERGFVPRGSRVADIGSGHGILPRLLLASGRASYCIASAATGRPRSMSRTASM